LRLSSYPPLLVPTWARTTVIDGIPTRRLRFAGDSLVEGDGFDPLVRQKATGVLVL
jgi:hypothetical protein